MERRTAATSAHVPTLLSTPEQAWYRGIMARTAFCDAPPVNRRPPIAVSPDNYAYWHERGQSADGSAFQWFIQTADNYLDPDQNMMVRQIWPDFQGQVGPIMVELATSFTPQGEVTIAAGSTMAPGDAKSDVRATGRLVRVKFSGNSAPTAARLGSPTFLVSPAGGR
jgi:hypothetical protein